MTTYRLIIMRHATQQGAGDGTDHARTLTAVGREEAHRVGLRLRELGFEPRRVLSSTAIRCRETWDSMRASFTSPPGVDFLDALYNAGAEELLGTLHGEDARGTLLLLAHNPGVSMLSFELARGRIEDEASLRGGFAPASFAVFEIEEDGAPISVRNSRLLHFERPARVASM